MKNIAFLFSKSPYGSVSCKECLDMALSVSLIIKNVGIFFLGDGILQVISNQKSNKIFSFNYSKSFSILEIYKMSNIYFYKDSLKERGIKINENFLVKPTFLKKKDFIKKLSLFDFIINC
ncbi:sulfurtransferase complex subunit TusC [Buchnera aphidicola (Ceratoglyphina bambusae)]|uniref:sulfurtransferase complex subunit TusC n=1 Tax=Buchnera aphidicola TaxID=9 RepID=UPI0031B8A466